ncbi:MAG: glycosyltransferase [Elusimicrobiota bacterium]
MGRTLIYLVSGRSASKKNPGRKIQSLISCWQKLGFQIEPVFGGNVTGGVGDEGNAYGQMEYYGKWYRRIGVLSPLVTSVSERRDIAHDRHVASHLRRLAAADRLDAIWERSSRLHCAGLTVARELGIPYILEWKDHLVPYALSWHRKEALAMERRKNQGADYIVVESEVLREALSGEGIPRDKILVAYNAVSPEDFAPDASARQRWRSVFGVSPEDVLVGYLGSYAFYHDSSRLILAADIIRQRGIRGIKVVMMGMGKDYHYCRNLAAKMGLLDSTVVMNPGVPPDDVPAVLSALDIGTLPGSTDIICPIKIPEYMAAGLPVLAPDYPCNREIVAHRETGLLFAPGNERSLAESIVELAADKALRLRLGRSAREAALAQFTWEKTWGAVLQKIFGRIRGA